MCECMPKSYLKPSIKHKTTQKIDFVKCQFEMSTIVKKGANKYVKRYHGYMASACKKNWSTCAPKKTTN